MSDRNMQDGNRVRSVAVSIYRTHAKRIGYLRVFLAAVLMYSTIPLFIFLHTGVSILFYGCVLVPLVGVPALDRHAYIVLDRYRYQELGWFDRLNCLYCEYANGTVLLMQQQLKEVAQYQARTSLARVVAVHILLAPATALLLVSMLLATLPTNIFMKMLRLHRGSHKRVAKRLAEEEFGAHLDAYSLRMLRFYKISADVIAYNLEQIESQWCPIRHLERVGYCFPEHHKNFMKRDALLHMQEVLLHDGTVSDNKLK